MSAEKKRVEVDGLGEASQSTNCPSLYRFQKKEQSVIYIIISMTGTSLHQAWQDVRL